MHLFLFRPYPGEILEHAPFFLLLFAIQSGRAHCSSLSERPRDRASHQRLGPLFRLLMPVGVWAHKPAQAISTYLLPVQLLQLPDMGAAVNATIAGITISGDSPPPRSAESPYMEPKNLAVWG